MDPTAARIDLQRRRASLCAVPIQHGHGEAFAGQAQGDGFAVGRARDQLPVVSRFRGSR